MKPNRILYGLTTAYALVLVLASLVMPYLGLSSKPMGSFFGPMLRTSSKVNRKLSSGLELLLSGASIGLVSYAASFLSLGVLGIISTLSLTTRLQVPLTHELAFRLAILIATLSTSTAGFSDGISVLLAMRMKRWKKPSTLMRFMAYAMGMGALPFMSLVLSLGSFNSLPIPRDAMDPLLISTTLMGAPMVTFLRTRRIRTSPWVVILVGEILVLPAAMLHLLRPDLLSLGPMFGLVLALAMPLDKFRVEVRTLPKLSTQGLEQHDAGLEMALKALSEVCES